MKNKPLAIFLCIQAIISMLVIMYFDGTGDSGDSIMHYLFAKYSFKHPELFFDHWAKPVYVLLASPFAQYGFTGIKVFNATVMLMTVFFTYKTIEKLNLKNPVIGVLFLLFSPLVFILTFSGLTEHLFSLFLIISIYLLLADKPIAACLIVSFLPFIRSEGLIFIGIIGLYLLMQRKWKLLPWLISGHVAYSIAGFPVYHDILWVFNKIPYASLNSTYNALFSNEGRLLHFAEQMNYVVGVPIYFLFWLGILSIIHQAIRKSISRELVVLIIFGFFAFFLAHTLFWYLGIFNSMGLKRVLISVAPLSSIISLLGFNYILEFSDKRKSLKLFLKIVIVLYVVIFPFTSNPAAINWKKDLSRSGDQKLADKVALSLSSDKYSGRRFVYAHPYLSEALNIDWFDSNKHLDLNKQHFGHIKTGDMIIWENWFAVVEGGITKEYLENNKQLKLLYNVSENDDREILFSIYEYPDQAGQTNIP